MRGFCRGKGICIVCRAKCRGIARPGGYPLLPAVPRRNHHRLDDERFWSRSIGSYPFARTASENVPIYPKTIATYLFLSASASEFAAASPCFAGCLPNEPDDVEQNTKYCGFLCYETQHLLVIAPVPKEAQNAAAGENPSSEGECFTPSF